MELRGEFGHHLETPLTRAALRVGLAFVALLLLSVVPIFSTVLPPLFDYPNHLARMHLIAEGGNAFFAVHWRPLPNLAEDLIVPTLARIVPLDQAGKLFLVLIFGLTAGGTVLLNRAATGVWRVWPLLAFLILYNRSFLWGFENYAFGQGLALLGLALWLALSAAPILRVAAATVVALGCYVSHIEAFGLYAVAVAGVEAVPAIQDLRAGDIRGLAGRAAIYLVPLLLPVILVAMTWHAAASPGWDLAGYARKPDLLFSVFDNYSRPFDVACFAVFVGGLGWLMATGRVACHPRLGTAAALLFLVYLVLPSRLFGGAGADHRLPPALFLLLIAAGVPRFQVQMARGIAIAACVMLALRLGVVEIVWLRADRVYRADLAALDLLPAGARLAVAFPPRATNLIAIPETHLPTLAIARREAFVPTLFAFPTQQPVDLRPSAAPSTAVAPETVWAALAEHDAGLLDAANTDLARYDYLVLIDRAPFAFDGGACLTPLAVSPTFKLFAINQAGAASPAGPCRGS